MVFGKMDMPSVNSDCRQNLDGNSAGVFVDAIH